MDTERIIRHPNGGAAKIGLGVHVSQDSYCDGRSTLRGDTSVFSSTLMGALINDCYVFNSTMDRSLGINTTIAESSCLRLHAKNATLHRVDVIADEGAIVLIDVIAENCKLWGSWLLQGNARICEGSWRRAPRFKRITGENGVDFGLTEALPGYAMLGCWKKPLKTLLHAGPALGRKKGWTEQQIKTAKEFYEELADCPLPL